MNQFRSLFLFATLMLASCASAPGQAPGTDKQHEAITEEERSAACEEGFAPNVNDGRACNVTYDDKCFETAAEACACAGCGEAECVILESYPAQARCAAVPSEPNPDFDQGNSSDGASSSPAAPAAPSEGPSVPPAAPTAPSDGSSIPPSSHTSPDGGSSIPPTPPGGGSVPPAPPSQPRPTPAQCSGGVPEANAGSNDACNLIHAGQCFVNVEDACACAGCEIEDCRVLESYPARVICD